MSARSDQRSIGDRSFRAIAATVAIILGFGATPARAEEFRHEGEYSVDCGKAGLQCWWEITRKGARDDGTPTFDFRFIAADRFDPGKVNCSLQGEGFADVLAIGQGLVAYMGPEEIPLHMRESKGGVLFAFANATDGMSRCNGANVEGNLTPIGD